MKPLSAAVRQEFLDCFQRHGIGQILHYTPIANIPSILRHGSLLSRSLQRQRDIYPAGKHGWGGREQILSQWICCALHPPRAMLRTSRETCAVLQVDVSAAATLDTLFCPVNSARSVISTEEILARRDVQCLEVLFASAETSRLRNTECELLIPGQISLGLVKGIAFPDRATRRRAAALCWRAGLHRVALGWRQPAWSVNAVLF